MSLMDVSWTVRQTPKMMFSWDNQHENFDEACYSLQSDSDTLQLAGSVLVLMASQLPDEIFQKYLDRPLHGFNSEVQQRLLFIGKQLLNAQLCVKNEVIVGAFVGQIVSGMWWDELPDGLLPADGSTHLKADWPELWALLETTPLTGFYEVSETEFKTPDRQGTVGVGLDTSDSDFGGVGQFGGEKTHTLTTTELPAHSHNMPANVYSGSGSKATSAGGSNDLFAFINLGVPFGSTQNAGSGTAHNNMPPYHVERVCIVARISYPVPDTFKLRQSPDDNCLLEQSVNGGSYWTPAFDFAQCRSITKGGNGSLDQINNFIDASISLSNIVNEYAGDVTNINNDFVYDMTSEDGLRDDGLCFALTLFIDYLSGVAYDIASGEIDSNASVNETAAALFGGASGLLGIAGAALVGLVSPLAAAIAPLGLALASVLSIVVAANIREMEINEPTDEEKDDLVCSMYGALAGNTISEASFRLALDAADFTPLTNQYFLADAISQMIQSTDVFVSFLQILSATIDAAIDGVVLPCPCNPENCVEVVFTSAGSASPFVVLSGSTFTSTVGVIANADGDPAGITLEFDEPVIVTTVEVDWRRPKNVPPGLNGNNLTISDISSGYTPIGNTGSTGTSGTAYTVFTLDRAMTKLQIYASGSGVVDATYKKGLILRVKVCWQGAGVPI